MGFAAAAATAAKRCLPCFPLPCYAVPMSAVELALEKIKRLDEAQARELPAWLEAQPAGQEGTIGEIGCLTGRGPGKREARGTNAGAR
jgi:hypothetical protein